MFQFSKFLIFGVGFASFWISGITLIINSIPSLYWIEFLWTLLYTIGSYHALNINFSEMTYFYIICLYLKLKLRIVNNSIRNGIEKKCQTNYYRTNNTLKSFTVK